MKVIFLQDVPRVGRKYDVKDVNDGYASNFLLPRKLATPATKKAVAEVELRKKEIAIERRVQDDLLQKNMEEIKGKSITIKGKANELGHLFSSIHKKEIVEELKKQAHADVNEEFIILDKPLKATGEFEIPISVQGKKSSFKVIIEKI